MLPKHEVIHTSRLGWGELKNGKLLAGAEAAGFDVMITVDRSMRFQQNLTGRKLGVIFLHTLRNDALTLGPMAEMVSTQLETLPPGEIAILTHPDWPE